MKQNGHCLCRAVTFELTGPHKSASHCHCDSCRRGAGAAIITFIGHPNGKWQWTGKTPAVYVSSPGNERLFCTTCGSSVAFQSPRYPDEVYFHAALLENPNQVAPGDIGHADARLNWMPDHMPGC